MFDRNNEEKTASISVYIITQKLKLVEMDLLLYKQVLTRLLSKKTLILYVLMHSCMRIKANEQLFVKTRL